MIPYEVSLGGGALIGLSAAVLLVFNGRVAGISGIVGRLVQGAQISSNVAFTVGLVAGPALYLEAFGSWPASTTPSSLFLVIAAGLLVGFGTRMGSGCTSGHGVVGLARLSRRSIIAVVTFLIAGILTVLVMRQLAS